MEKFSSYLKGDWNNREQSLDFPALWSHIHVCYHPLPMDLLNGPSFYVESAYDYMLDKPYKTAVVQLVENGEIIEMNNFRVIQPEEFWYGSHDPSLLTGLNIKRLTQLPSVCNTIFEYDAEAQLFSGFTKPGKKCIIARNGKKTYLDSRILLGKEFYSSWDIGRDVENDEQLWGATGGPFVFKKKQSN